MLKKFLDKRKLIDITWIDDPELFNQINNGINRYRKDKIQLNYYLFKTF